MKQEYKHIDDLLRDSLEGYSKPVSPGLWRKISFGLLLRSRRVYLSIVVLVLATGALYLLQSQHEELPAEEIFLETPQEVSGTSSLITQTQVEENFDQQTTVSEIQNATDEIADQDILSTNDPVMQSPAMQVSLTLPVEKSSEETEQAKPSNHFNLYPGLEQRMGVAMSVQSERNIYLQGNQFKYYPESIVLRKNFIDRKHQTDYGFTKSRALLLQITPELIFSGDDRNEITEAMNIDLSYVLEGKDGFLQIGAGIGISKDDGIFNVNYSQYDSIGYYEQVNSFFLNPSTGQPEFSTTTEGVFDTIAYGFQETTRNLYYYFRIPLTAGLKVYDFKKIALYAEIGGTYSLLFKKHEPGIKYTNDQATQLEIIDNTPSRVQSNVQLSLGAGLKYRLSNKFDLRLDGMYNYYWNAIIERQYKQKSPFSVSLKVGIMIKL